MSTRFGPFLLALCLLPLVYAPALAGEPGGAAVFGDYWQGFKDYWKALFQKQNGVVMGVLGVGAVALFIITRGKWKK
jgi:hypothetical protein